MKKKNKINSLKANFIKSFVFLMLVATGCMESILPDSTNNKKLTIEVMQVLNQNQNTKTPIQGADISIFNIKTDSNQLVVNGLTNQLGLVHFDLKGSIVGTPYLITASYNNQKQIRSINLCADQIERFQFDTIYIPPVLCANLNRTDSTIFYDNVGSNKLYQNTPSGINYYTRSISIVNDPANNDVIEATLPILPSPYSYKALFLDNQLLTISSPQTVKIAPGKQLDILIASSTNSLGIFDNKLQIPLKCLTSGNTGIYQFDLHSEVIQPICKCQDASPFNTKIEPIKVGESKTISGIVYTNELPCDVTINKVSFDGNDGWAILSPTFPMTLKQGEKLSIAARFTALRALKGIDTLKVSISPSGGSANCNLDVIYEGSGCKEQCPSVGKSLSNMKIFSATDIVDILSNRSDNYVMISIPNSNPPEFSTVSGSYFISYPDSACEPVKVAISVTYADDYAKKFFEVIPQSLTLDPGSKSPINVVFTAPGLSEFQNILVARLNGKQPTKKDSSFSIIITLSTPTCRQNINVTAVINTLPDISPIINLRAYAQLTPLKQIPENEVYSFGDNARTILYNGAPASYPPIKGHIWIDVVNNNNGVPPQAPILKTINGLGMKVWKKGYLESDFSNVVKIFNEFSLDPNNKSGYSTSDINNLQVGDVIAYAVNPPIYALIYIRRIDNGTEQTSSKQSGIEFRAIYKIILP